MRLIDADALKYKNLAEVNGRLTYVLTAEEIDNAPTILKDNRPNICFNCEHCCALTVDSDGKVKVMCNLGAEICDKQRPQGEWLDEKVVAFHLTCNKCGCNIRKMKTEVFEGNYNYNFCPNCGAKMQKGGAE